MSAVAIVVLTTVSSFEEGKNLARKIVETKLAACVQILPPMTSIYTWENQIQTDSENLLLIKTLSTKFAELKEFIQTNHSYDVPEIVALSVEDISENYFGWLKNSLN